MSQEVKACSMTCDACVLGFYSPAAAASAALIAAAASAYREKGDRSDLHIIIFDEIDAICKQRGSTRDGTGVHDTIVNQLLTKVGCHN